MKRKKVKKHLSSFSKAIDLLIKQVGGPAALSRVLAREGIKASPSLVNNWRVLGRVPIRSAQHVARILAVDPWLLSYLDYQKAFSPAPKWGRVVSKGPFTTTEKKEILKDYKEI
jgi:hypothetical protein